VVAGTDQSTSIFFILLVHQQAPMPAKKEDMCQFLSVSSVCSLIKNVQNRFGSVSISIITGRPADTAVANAGFSSPG